MIFSPSGRIKNSRRSSELWKRRLDGRNEPMQVIIEVGKLKRCLDDQNESMPVMMRVIREGSDLTVEMSRSSCGVAGLNAHTVFRAV